MKNGAVGKLTAKIRENKREDGRNCPVGSCWWEGGKESRSYPVKGKWDGLLRLNGVYNVSYVSSMPFRIHFVD